MANDVLGQILGSVLCNGPGRQAGFPGGAMAGGMGGNLGELMGGLMGRIVSPRVPDGLHRPGSMGGMGGTGGMGRSGRGELMIVLLPLAMQWVQLSGGLGAVLRRFQQQGYSQQAASWVSTGPNKGLAAHAINDVVGLDELSRLSRRLGVSQDEVSSGLAQILPEMVNQLTPDGAVPADADDVLYRGLSTLEDFMNPEAAR